MARVLADAAGRHPLWTESLKRWNMRESPTVNGWIEEGRVEGREVSDVVKEALAEVPVLGTQ